MVPPLSLVVHFGSWGNAVDGDEEPFVRLDVIHNVIDVVHDCSENFIEPFSFKNVLENSSFVFSATIQHTVQIDVEVVNVRHNLATEAFSEEGIPPCNPCVEIVDTHCVVSSGIYCCLKGSCIFIPGF